MAIEVSTEGIIKTGESLTSYANELSDLFSSLSQVSSSLGANITGFAEIEQLVDVLTKVNSAKDKLVSKVKEFADYLINTVAPGYGDFIKDVENIDANTDNPLDTLAALLAGGTTLTKGVSNTTPTSEEQPVFEQEKPKTDANGNTEGVNPSETPKSDTTSPQNTQNVLGNPATAVSNPNVVPSNSNVQWVWDEEHQMYMLKPAEGAVGKTKDLVNGPGSGPSQYWN